MITKTTIQSLDLKNPNYSNLIYLDTETTGLDVSGIDKMIEIAMVKTNEQGNCVFESLINPGCLISHSTSKINSISNEMVQNAPYFKDIAKDILDFIDGNIIVCHNANFDLALLKKEMSFVFQTDIKFKYIDTLRLARKYFNFQSNALGAIAYALGIETKELHRAMADVKIMMSISKYLFLNMYRKGIEFVEPSLF